MSVHGNLTGALRARAGDALGSDLARLGEAALQRSSLCVGAHVARPGARGGALYDVGDHDREWTIERAAGAPKICARFGRRLAHCARPMAYPPLGAIRRRSGRLRRGPISISVDPPRSRWRVSISMARVGVVAGQRLPRRARWRGAFCPGVGRRATRTEPARGARGYAGGASCAARGGAGASGEARMILVRIAREPRRAPRAGGAWGSAHSGCHRTCPRALRSDRGGRRERA